MTSTSKKTMEMARHIVMNWELVKDLTKAQWRSRRTTWRDMYLAAREFGWKEQAAIRLADKVMGVKHD